MNTLKFRLIAFYLPQFHPIPENDLWWGKGFTEWTNVGKAKKLFRNHNQPRVPADLGYYDLRLNETRLAQASLARKYGIEGFCYWHYWFGNGKRLLERPFDEVLASGKPNFPFCLAWANATWTGKWDGLRNKVLLEQKYPGVEDYKAHYQLVRPAFLDKRYIKVAGRPLFVIYKPLEVPDLEEFIDTWNKFAKEDGLFGVHFVGIMNNIDSSKDILFQKGINAIACSRLEAACRQSNTFFKRINLKWFGGLKKYNYKDIYNHLVGKEEFLEEFYPVASPNWDYSPRGGSGSLIITKDSAELFKLHLIDVLNRVKQKQPEHRIVFIKSWNEWAEGNYLEPDLRFGLKYLEVLQKVFGE